MAKFTVRKALQEKGVDKRIDILATAIKGNLTILICQVGIYLCTTVLALLKISQYARLYSINLVEGLR